MSGQMQSAEAPPTIFRYDYPEAAADEWAVFWEVDDELEFAARAGRIDDPTEIASAWLAISQRAVVDVKEHA